MILQRRDPESPFFGALTRAAQQLFELLIAPAADAIGDSERILIVADGALHRLPFAALIEPDGEYLVAKRPVHSVLSTTLYGRLRAKPEPSEASPSRLAAFGDPLYPTRLHEGPALTPEPRVRSLLRRSVLDFAPLPHSRREIDGIVELFQPTEVASSQGRGRRNPPCGRCSLESISCISPCTAISTIDFR